MSSSYLPRSRTRARAYAAVAALLALALLALTACGSSGNPRPRTIDSYVSLGDSYTAVAGDGPFTDTACHRSADNYPGLVAKALGITEATDVSCGGATSADLTQDQVTQNPAATRAPQLAAVTKRTKLVTLGIGLNDYQLAYYLLYVCVPINGITLPACGQYLKLPDSSVETYVSQMTAQVKQNLADVRKAAPKARIVLVGYPRVLADDADCPAQLPMPAAASARLRTALELVDTEYAALAKKAKVDYVDMWKASKGHDVCSADPWVNGQANLAGKALQFHPYKAYHQAVAKRIVALLKK